MLTTMSETTESTTTDTKTAEPKIVKVRVRDTSCRGDTVHTRWGDAKFDREGYAELDVPEADLGVDLLLKWGAEPVVAETKKKK
jgi:hypothetical protein